MSSDQGPVSARIQCPECEQGKTVNCVGVALDFERDEFVPCETTNQTEGAES